MLADGSDALTLEISFPAPIILTRLRTRDRDSERAPVALKF